MQVHALPDAMLGLGSCLVLSMIFHYCRAGGVYLLFHSKKECMRGHTKCLMFDARSA